MIIDLTVVSTMKKEDLEAYSLSTNEILTGKYYGIVYLTLRVLKTTEITVTWHSWHTVLLLGHT